MEQEVQLSVDKPWVNPVNLIQLHSTSLGILVGAKNHSDL